MSHDISYNNSIFNGNGPFSGLIMAGYPDHFCPRCFSQQDISNRGKLCGLCSTYIKTKQQELTIIQQELS